MSPADLLEQLLALWQAFVSVAVGSPQQPIVPVPSVTVGNGRDWLSVLQGFGPVIALVGAAWLARRARKADLSAELNRDAREKIAAYAAAFNVVRKTGNEVARDLSVLDARQRYGVASAALTEAVVGAELYPLPPKIQSSQQFGMNLAGDLLDGIRLAVEKNDRSQMDAIVKALNRHFDVHRDLVREEFGATGRAALKQETRGTAARSRLRAILRR